MSFGFLGIQFGFALQNANVSRIFQSLGASIDDMPMLWIAAPVTGLLVQPVIGYLSDRTWSRLGRRRPYFLAGAVLATLALFAMPNSPALWIAAGLLWMLDASINISMEPFRAFVGDMLPDRQRAFGFAMQSLFIGIGAVVSLGVAVDAGQLGRRDATSRRTGEMPDTVNWAFYIGAVAFIGAVSWTVCRTREYPPAAVRGVPCAARDGRDLAAGGEPERMAVPGLGTAWSSRAASSASRSRSSAGTGSSTCSASAAPHSACSRSRRALAAVLGPDGGCALRAS